MKLYIKIFNYFNCRKMMQLQVVKCWGCLKRCSLSSKSNLNRKAQTAERTVAASRIKVCLGADHLTLEGGGGISGHQEFFFSNNLVGRIFFSLLNALQDIFFPPHFSAGFFFLKKGSCVYIYKMYLHLHCGQCSNSSNMELQSLKML